MMTTTMSRIASYWSVIGFHPPSDLGLEDAARPVHDVRAVPPEVLVGVIDPLVGHDTEGEEHHAERVHGTEHRLAPR